MDEKIDSGTGSVQEVLSRGSRGIDEEDVHRVAADEEGFRKKLRRSPESFIERVGGKLELLISAIRDYAAGNYRDVPWLTIALAAFAIIYFINPADIIPDILPLSGLIDDAGVIAAAYAAIVRDLNRYERWKDQQSSPDETDSGESVT